MKLYTEEQVREVLSNMLLTTKQVESILKELSPQDPAVCEYSGLRPVEGYKEEEIELEEGVEMFKIGGETDEEKAYRRGYMDGYDEGLYDGENK